MMEITKGAVDIGLVTVNEPAMLDFYHGLLGLPQAGEVPIPGTGRIVKLQCGDTVLKLFVLDTPPPADRPVGSYLAATGLRYFTITIADIRQVVEACRAAGLAIVNEIVQPRPGLLAAMVQDPDGNTIELMEVA